MGVKTLTSRLGRGGSLGYQGGSPVLFRYSAGDSIAEATFTRPSLATYMDDEQMVAYAANNYAFPSIPGAGWVPQGSSTITANNGAAPDGSVTASRLTFGPEAGLQQIYRGSWTITGALWSLTAWVKGTAGEKIHLSSASGPLTEHTFSGAWEKVSVSGIPDVTYIAFRIDRGSLPTNPATTFLVWHCQVEQNRVPCGTILPTTGAARFDGIRDSHYVYDTPSETYVRTTLLEGQRTNLQTNSQSIGGTAWSSGPTATQNFAIAPDGSMTAAKLQSTGSGAQWTYSNAVAGIAGTSYTQSFFVKYVDCPWINLRHECDGGQYNTWFNIQTGTIGSALSDRHGIEPIGNGWFRIWESTTSGSAAGSNPCLIQLTDTDSSAQPPAAGTSVLVWGAQFENNTHFPSSYIPTVAAAVTRATDQFNFPFSETGEMTFYVRSVNQNHREPGNPRLVELGNETIPWMTIYDDGSQTRASAFINYVSLSSGVPIDVSGEVTIGDSREVLFQMIGSGPLLSQSVNRGTVLSASPVPPVDTSETPFGRLHINSYLANSVNFQAYQDVLIAKGVKDLAYFRGLIKTPSYSVSGGGSTEINGIYEMDYSAPPAGWEIIYRKSPSIFLGRFSNGYWYCVSAGTNMYHTAAATASPIGAAFVLDAGGANPTPTVDRA